MSAQASVVRGTDGNERSIDGKATFRTVESKMTKNCPNDVSRRAYQARRGMITSGRAEATWVRIRAAWPTDRGCV